MSKNLFLKLQFIFVISLTMSGCFTITRHGDSGYASASNKQSRSGWKVVDAKNKDKSSQREIPINDLQLKLKQLENGLSTRKEIEQYSRNLPWFKNEEEKVEFLSLLNYEEKQKWLTYNDIQGRSLRIKDALKEVVDSQDIAVGMPEDLVRKSWGDPQFVDVSGNPSFRNQRWRYTKFVASPDGYKEERKIVYIEGGKVKGWEVE